MKRAAQKTLDTFFKVSESPSKIAKLNKRILFNKFIIQQLYLHKILKRKLLLFSDYCFYEQSDPPFTQDIEKKQEVIPVLFMKYNHRIGEC